MIHFFTDPILRAPTLGCILMCIASSLMGTLLFLQKRSLLSETLSHATYPGAVIAVFILGLFFPNQEEWTFLAVLVGALISSFLGLKAVDFLERRNKVHPDAALCFVITVFFGIGVVAASALQGELPAWKNQIQMLLFGQAATMSDFHIWIYGTLAMTVALFLALTFRSLQCFLFDRNYAATAGLPVLFLERMFTCLLLLSLIVGIRSVGVVLLSGMVVAPAVAARQFTNRLQTMLFLSALFGSLSGFLGNYLSVIGSLPTGPMIVLVGTSFALLSLCFAPKRGVVFRLARVLSFRLRCLEENILKAIWKKGVFDPSQFSPLQLKLCLGRLKREGWLTSDNRLTNDGMQKASSIVRLHRLWELYLTEKLGFQVEKVHRTAEEMEHILTPEMEQKLTSLLENPKQDPHQQPIPEKRG